MKSHQQSIYYSKFLYYIRRVYRGIALEFGRDYLIPKPFDKRVLEWPPEGKSFTIRDKAKLEREVLPKYFTVKCKFMSFVRKLYR